MAGNKGNLSKNNQQPIRLVRIVSEIVVDRNGNVIGTDPKQFPYITNKCKELIATLETGMNYKIVQNQPPHKGNNE